MAFREVDVIEVREVLRWWLDGAGLRTIAERAGVDRKTGTRMRAVCRLLGLVRRLGARPVDTACGTASELDVVSRGLQPHRQARRKNHFTSDTENTSAGYDSRAPGHHSGLQPEPSSPTKLNSPHTPPRPNLATPPTTSTHPRTWTMTNLRGRPRPRRSGPLIPSKDYRHPSRPKPRQRPID